MSLITTFCLVLFGFSAMAFAEIEIEDLKSQLKSLPGQMSSVEFSKAFICNEPSKFYVRTGQCKLHCEFGLCEEVCGWPQVVESTFQAEECGADPVSIYSSLGQSIFASANDYKDSSNSIALSLIKSVSLFYDAIEKIRIDQVLYPVRKSLIENGQMKQITVTLIALSIFPDKTKPESQGLMLTLDLQQSGLNQLMCLASNNSCETDQDYLIKRKGLVNAFN